MRPADILVQVRDRNLNRVGAITAKYLDLVATVRYNGIGDWTLILPKLHPMVVELSRRGSGIVVTVRGSTVFSGPTTAPSVETDKDHPDGTYTFTGITDDVILDGALAFPDPSIGTVDDQTTRTNDSRTGHGEDLIREYVAANIIPGVAPAERVAGFREFLALDGASLGRGSVMTQSPRYTKLSDLCAAIATYCGLRFHVVQEGLSLVLKVTETADKSGLVSFNIRNGTLTSESASVSAPSVTRAIVAGGGQGTARVVLERTTGDSVAAETQWGLVFEEFIDQRQTTDLTELESAGDKELIDKGTTNTAIKAVPSDDNTMVYNQDWAEGDTVGVIVQGQKTLATVSAVAFVLNSDNTLVGAAIGDVSGFNAQDALTARVDDTAQRVGNLERNAEVSDAGIAWTDIDGKPTTFPADWSGVTGKPTTFTPSQHDINGADHSGFPLTVAHGGTGETEALPAPQQIVGSQAANAIHATSFAAVPDVDSASVTLSKSAWVLITMGALLSISSGSLRCGVAASGALSLTPPVLGGSWGAVMWITNDNSQRSAQCLVLCPAGTTTFTLQAYMDSGSGGWVNYPSFGVTPIAWA